ncbi:MAG: hypothetical protein SGJ11_14155 [Phycisphaerae bacterium]|nr:hypothetical protein [Phycisphaerae bacterium]
MKRMNMKALAGGLALGLAAALTSGASGQSYNIDLGSVDSPPPAAYGAAWLAGQWNVLGVPVVGTFYPLVNLQGENDGVTLNNIGGTQLLLANDRATSGGDEALMDDMLIGFNNPVDVCIWINNLPNGPYEVLIYAMTPNVPGLLSRTRVDFANEGPAFVGGEWPGQHELTVTYSRHTVSVFNGKIGLHSGLFGTGVQWGINGIQVRPLVTGDLDGNGTVNGADLAVLLGAWGACTGCAADFNDDDLVNGADLAILLGGWS